MGRWQCPLLRLTSDGMVRIRTGTLVCRKPRSRCWRAVSPERCVRRALGDVHTHGCTDRSRGSAGQRRLGLVTRRSLARDHLFSSLPVAGPVNQVCCASRGHDAATWPDTSPSDIPPHHVGTSSRALRLLLGDPCREGFFLRQPSAGASVGFQGSERHLLRRHRPAVVRRRPDSNPSHQSHRLDLRLRAAVTEMT